VVYLCVCVFVLHADWSTERQALLFIGHALVGCHGATCRLHGISRVTEAYLNNMKLHRLSDVCVVYYDCLASICST